MITTSTRLSVITVLILGSILSGQAQTIYTPAPVAGFNQNIVANAPSTVASSTTSSMDQAVVIGNPVRGTATTLEICGTQELATKVQLLNLLGTMVQEQELTPGTAAVRSSLPLPAAAGLYVVRVRTSEGTATAKLLKE
jgi:hypothetical protein